MKKKLKKVKVHIQKKVCEKIEKQDWSNNLFWFAMGFGSGFAVWLYFVDTTCH